MFPQPVVSSSRAVPQFFSCLICFFQFIREWPGVHSKIKDLGGTAFKDRAVKMRVRGADGKMQLATFKGAAEKRPTEAKQA
jgi:hypothetical protein